MRTRFAATGRTARGLLSDRKVISEQPHCAGEVVERRFRPAVLEVEGCALEQVDHFSGRYLARVVRHRITSDTAASAAQSFQNHENLPARAPPRAQNFRASASAFRRQRRENRLAQPADLFLTFSVLDVGDQRRERARGAVAPRVCRECARVGRRVL